MVALDVLVVLLQSHLNVLQNNTALFVALSLPFGSRGLNQVLHRLGRSGLVHDQETFSGKIYARNEDIRRLRRCVRFIKGAEIGHLVSRG
jgi:hypothetical protein